MKQKIAFIGAGKVAHSLVPALKEKRFEITQIISNSLDSAEELAKNYNIKKFSCNLNDLSEENDIICLTVPDDQIKSVADNIAGLSVDLQFKKFIHFSGARNINDLQSLSDKGAIAAGIHIMQTFPNKNRMKIDSDFAAIECKDEKFKKELFELTAEVNLNAFEIKSEQKIFYHLLGVFASNFLVANFIAIENLSKSAGLKPELTSAYLESIVKATFENIKKHGASEAMSGVVVRKDFFTIEKHIEVLREKPDILKIYLSSQLLLVKIRMKDSPEDSELNFLRQKLEKEFHRINQDFT